MISRIFRHVSTIASLLLLVAVPTQASPISFADVVNVMGDLQKGSQTTQLRLRVTQDPTAPLTSRENSSSSANSATAPATDGDVTQAANALADLRGTRGGYLLVDRESGEALTVTLWESYDLMCASEVAAAGLRRQAMEAAQGTVAAVHLYEVAADFDGGAPR